MIGENIKKMRAEKGYTQKELADLLHVTAQAVSRWENGEAEPSIGTITEMADIFGVSTDDLIKGKPALQIIPPEPENEEEEPAPKTVIVEQKPVLAVCEQCNKPIYNGSEIVRKTYYHARRSSTQKILCRSCDEKNKAEALKNATEYGLLQRKRSFIWGGLITALILGVSLIITISNKLPVGAIIGIAAATLLFFPFISCLFLKNNFVGEMVGTVALWGSVRFPGLIFTLDLGGIAWLIVVKIAFWIIGFMIGLAAIALAVALGLIVSVFVYPFALRKSFEHPELTERI